MSDNLDDLERTQKYGHAALEHIKSLKHLANPRNYEFWYSYSAGFNFELNKAVDDVIKRKGSISEKEIELFYELYLSPQRLSNRYDEVGSKVLDEVGQVMSMIDTAKDIAGDYTESLNDIAVRIKDSDGREQLQDIVTNLMEVTDDVRKANKDLEDKLNSSKDEILKLQENIDAIRSESLTDPLTMLSNRKYFDLTLEKTLIEARQDNRSFALLVMDIDHFKSFNDKFGHLTGDQVLRLVSVAIKHNVKGQDIATRFGGEEFAVILPDTTLRAAMTVADHIRRAIMRKELVKRSTGESLGRITVSTGVAAYDPADTAQSLIERADKCLYAAKHAGRNRVVCETDPEMEAGYTTPVTTAAAD
jgi:diguanylate cyclase